MKTRSAITLFSLVLFASLSFAQDSGMESKSFKVNPGGKLSISLSVGDIYLSTADDNILNVKYNQDEGNDFDISQSGSNIEITSSSGSWGNELHVSLPSVFNISAKTMGGDIRIDGSLKGKLDCSTSGGDINSGNVEGSVKLQTSGGDINSGEITGDADISTSGGDIKLGKISGKASVSTSGGEIIMKGVGNTAEIMTSGGNISVANISGDARIKTGGGNLTVGKVLGNAQLKTGGGNIFLESASGSIDAESGAGNIELKNTGNKFKTITGFGDIHLNISGKLEGESLAKSGAGSIILYIPENARVTINASAQSTGWDDESNIISDFTPSKTSGGRKGSRQTFQINGGGSVIDVSTAMGNIQIKKAK